MRDSSVFLVLCLLHARRHLLVAAFAPTTASLWIENRRWRLSTTRTRVTKPSRQETLNRDVPEPWLFSTKEEEEKFFGLDSLDDEDESGSVATRTVSAQDGGDDDETDEIVRFVNRIKDTPPGSLDQDAVLLLRDTMDELLSLHELSTLQLSTASNLLQRIVQEYRAVEASETANIAPTTDDFVRLYAAWHRALVGHSGKVATDMMPTATTVIQQLLALQEQPFLQGVAAPDTTTYELVLQILSQSRYCSKQVWQIFSGLQEKTIPSYEAAITSAAKSRHAHAASRAEALLKEAADMGKVSVETCNHVLTAWAKSGLRHGPERAEELIRWMDTDADIAPNAQSFTCLLDARAQQASWEAAVQCERILENLVNLYIQESNPDLEPTVATWTIPLQAWSRLAKKNRNKAAKRAADVFLKWQTLYNEGKVTQGPDGLAYQIVLQAFVRHDAAEAEAWLDKQYDVYKQTGDATLRPTARSVRNVVDSWTRQHEVPSAMEEAEFVWERYQEVVDETASEGIVADLYRTILFGYCQRRKSERALEILQDMIDRDLHPDCFCYDRVLEATTQEMSRAEEEDCIDQALVDRAYSVFSLMEAQRQSGHVKPNERVYTSFIRSLTKARVPNLAYKARLLLQRMRDLSSTENVGIRPTTFTYNAVLLAAATDDSSSALSVALQTFNELRKDTKVELDHVSIGNMLRCANLLEEPTKRAALIKSTFSLGCQHGLVNAFVLRDLRLVATPEQQTELLGAEYSEEAEYDMILGNLPEQWTRKDGSKPVRV